MSDREDSQEDFSEESDDEVEWDEGPAAKKKKTRGRSGREITGGFFLDDEVEEASEEEDSGGEFEEGFDELTSRIRESFPARKGMDQMTDSEMRQLIRRYDGMGDEMGEDEMPEYEDVSSATSQKDRYPTIRDPRLWLVRCKPGEERKLVYAILQRCFERNEVGNPLAIKSAICTDHCKGYIHVEAKTAAQVRLAIQGLGIPLSAPIAIPMKEMPEVLKIPQKQISLEKGSWVRVKRGVYKGDLAQVNRVDENKVWVKIIPRLDLSATNDDEESTGKRKRQQRMPARFFNYEEVRAIVGEANLQRDVRDNITGERFDVYKKDKFKDGFLYKAISLKSLETSGIVPTLDEIKKFQERQSDDGYDDLASVSSVIARNTGKRKVLFSKGDLVEVIEGTLKNLTGVVESVQDDSVTFMPILDDFKKLLKVEASQLRKYFKEGDHVRVINGRYENETGFVVQVDHDVVVIFSDLTNTEFKALIHDIQECSNVTTGRIELGNYQLHDLVSLGQQSVGVIVKIERDSFQILDIHGSIKEVRLQEMGPKRYSSASFDKNQNQIVADDVVQILEGKLKGKQGTIKYVYRHHVFIHSREVIENSGICVLRSTAVQLVGNSKFGKPTDRGGFGRRGGDRGRGGARGGRGSARGRGGGKFQKYSSTPVKIVVGPYKGHMGLVRDFSDDHYRVELTSKNKIVTVPVNGIEEKNKNGSTERSGRTPPRRTDGSTPGWGDRTPAYVPGTPYGGDRTPMWPSGDKTPNRGDSTPSRNWGDRTPNRGDSTPSRNWGDRTPNRGDSTPNRGDGTPSHEWPSNNPITPSVPDYSNSWGSSSNDNWGGAPTTNLMTPSYQAYSPYGQMTPADHYPTTPKGYMDNPYPLESPNNYYGAVTPQAYPQTPATPMTIPQTPGISDSYSGYDNHFDDNSRLATEIEVRIDENNGQFGGELAVIVDVGAHSSKVKLLGSGSYATIPNDMLNPTAPAKGDRIKIIRGEFKGSYGSLRAIDENSGIVNMDSLDITIIGMHNIAKHVRVD